MTFTIQLCFAGQLLKDLFVDLNSPVTRRRDRPHLSLSVFDAPDELGLEQLMETLFSDLEPIPILVSSIGIFPTEENAAFLAPKPTANLLNVHGTLHDQLIKMGVTVWPRYARAMGSAHRDLDGQLRRDEAHRDGVAGAPRPSCIRAPSCKCRGTRANRTAKPTALEDRPVS
jgi:hypothetical protein